MQSQDDRKISEKGSVHFSALSHLSITTTDYDGQTGRGEWELWGHMPIALGSIPGAAARGSVFRESLHCLSYSTAPKTLRGLRLFAG